MKHSWIPVIALWWGALGASAQESKLPLYPCSDRLEGAYGVCTHITRPRVDYEMRDAQLKRMHEAGMTMARSDLDFYNYMPQQGRPTPALFDSVLESCEAAGIGLLGIVTHPHGYAWAQPQWYHEYVESMAKRYDGRIRYWEVMNEVNLYRGVDSLPQRYTEVLKSTYEQLKRQNPDNQVLLTGMAEVTNSFLEDIGQLGAHRYFDIMNFHSYLEPEDLIPSFHKIRQVMDQQGWHKPVWLTECGMHTAEDEYPYEGFFTDLLPHALRRIGMDESRLEVGYLRDKETGYCALTDDEAESYLTGLCRRHRAVSWSELQQLSVSKTPVLVATRSEFFPQQHLPALVDYVRRGGTVVFPYGCPLYYDSYTSEGIGKPNTTRGTRDYHLLHMSSLSRWEDPATGQRLTEAPPVWGRTGETDMKYEWALSERSPARYMSDEHLAPGDTLIPLVTAGTETYRHAVAGIYRLGSDLRGNVIFQTRLYCNTSPSRILEQARRVARIHLLAFAHGINRVMWYNLCASEADRLEPEDNFGLLHRDLSDKPSFVAYCTLNKMLPDGSTRPTLKREGDVYQATWTRPDGTQVFAAWCSTGRHTIDNPLPRRARWYDHMGRPMKQGRQVQLSTGVIYGEIHK